MSSWTGIFGEQRSDACRQCGQRHHLRSRQNRICGASDDRDAWLVSAKGIAELAGEARLEGIARTKAAALATPGGPRQARHLAEAAKAFAQAYELEN